MLNITCDKADNMLNVGDANADDEFASWQKMFFAQSSEPVMFRIFVIGRSFVGVCDGVWVGARGCGECAGKLIKKAKTGYERPS